MSLDNMTPLYDDGKRVLYEAEAVSFMQSLPANSVDSLVTDPPYLISFMNRSWESAHKTQQGQNEGQQMQAWHYAWAVEALRVAKPGAHALVASLPRNHHRLMSAMEDAGWELRDVVLHIFGSGFPKSLDISKAIDREAGAVREVIGTKPGHEGFANRVDPHSAGSDRPGWERPWKNDPEKVAASHHLTAPATEAAQQWAGWGSALKPAAEYWVLARKPLQGNLSQNIRRWGVGGLNIDASRIDGSGNKTFERDAGDRSREHYRTGTTIGAAIPSTQGRFPSNILFTHDARCQALGTRRVKGSAPQGSGQNWQPANSIFGIQEHAVSAQYTDADGLEEVEVWRCTDTCPVGMLDRQAGERTSRGHNGGYMKGLGYGGGLGREVEPVVSSTGAASRFFFCAKADRAERGEGNTWPTVKPLALMEYLITLVTPPGGVILEPFAGSGTTLLAARNRGFRIIACDQDHDACQMALSRIDEERLPLFR